MTVSALENVAQNCIIIIVERIEIIGAFVSWYSYLI